MVAVQAVEQSGLRRLRDRTVLEIGSKDEVKNILSSLWDNEGVANNGNRRRTEEMIRNDFFQRGLEEMMSMSMSMSM
jgi:hypothetical protein